MNYFEFWGGDYLRDTSRLKMVEHGAYLKLMLPYYGEEQALPPDYEDLYQIACAITPADKAAVRKIADKFFPIAHDGLRRNGRIDAEIAKARKRIEIARQNGRSHKPAGNPAGMPPGMPAGDPSGNPDLTQRVTRSGKALHAPHEEQNLNQKLPATPGEKPPADEPTPSDPIWGNGLDFLLRKGLAKGSARSLIGLMRKELKDDFIVAELLIEAERQDICSPQAWLLQAAKQRKTGETNATNTRNRKLSLADQAAQLMLERRERRAAEEATTVGYGPGRTLAHDG